MKKMKILICRILKAVHYRVYKCTAILHTPMGRIHGKNSMSKLDNDAKRVANIYMELPHNGYCTIALLHKHNTIALLYKHSNSTSYNWHCTIVLVCVANVVQRRQQDL